MDDMELIISKKIFKPLLVLAVLMSAGCVNEFLIESEDSAGTVVTVGFEQTKTYLGELLDGSRKVYWSDNDQISINGYTSTSIKIAEGNASAMFEFDAILKRPYNILYPAVDYLDAEIINLPAVQAAATGTFAADYAPMAGYAAEGDALLLQHLAGVVRLQIKLPAENQHSGHILNRVEFRGNNGEQVSGNFTINYQDVSIAATSSSDADKVVVTKVNKALSAET